ALDDVVTALGRAGVDWTRSSARAEPPALRAREARSGEAVSHEQQLHAALVEELEHLIEAGRAVAVWGEPLLQTPQRLLLAAALRRLNQRQRPVVDLSRRGALDVDRKAAREETAKLGATLELVFDLAVKLRVATDHQAVERAPLEALGQNRAGSAN